MKIHALVLATASKPNDVELNFSMGNLEPEDWYARCIAKTTMELLVDTLKAFFGCITESAPDSDLAHRTVSCSQSTAEKTFLRALSCPSLLLGDSFSKSFSIQSFSRNPCSVTLEPRAGNGPFRGRPQAIELSFHARGDSGSLALTGPAQTVDSKTAQALLETVANAIRLSASRATETLPFGIEHALSVLTSQPALRNLTATRREDGGRVLEPWSVSSVFYQDEDARTDVTHHFLIDWQPSLSGGDQSIQTTLSVVSVGEETKLELFASDVGSADDSRAQTNASWVNAALRKITNQITREKRQVAIAA